MKHHEKPHECEQGNLPLARTGLQQGKMGAEDFAVQENGATATRRIRAIKTSLQKACSIGLLNMCRIMPRQRTLTRQHFRKAKERDFT